MLNSIYLSGIYISLEITNINEKFKYFVINFFNGSNLS